MRTIVGKLVSRQLVASVLAAAMGSVALLGYALHGLPGLKHSWSCNCAFHPAAAPLLADDAGGAGLLHAGHDNDHGDCAICSFLALAKHVEVASPGVSASNCSTAVELADYLSPHRATLSPYGARGPPSCALLAV